MKSALHRAFCENVRRRRADLGLTMTQLAERLGVSLPAVSMMESGKNMPGLDRIEQVAAALEIAPSELLEVRELAER